METVTERPILFSALMVRAILDGRKTQTRRVMKPQPITGKDSFGGYMKLKGYEADYPDDMAWLIEKACPYGQAGDRLWVRETWTDKGVMDGQYAYRADGEPPPWIATEESFRWRSSIHMPKTASRITLKITDVRVQRLQEISEEDARAEGIERYAEGHGFVSETEVAMDPGWSNFARYRTGFSVLWDEINGPGSWEVNPWVWAISFQRIHQSSSKERVA
jgi:hypothetical protein